MSSTDLPVRPAGPDDDDAVIALLRLSLGKRPDDPYERFFTWKHRENPFGDSPAWVAEDRGEIVGYRTFLRWEFVGPGDDRTRAVRAVDTATHPAYRGRGIFRSLTMAALEDLTGDGVDLVFNTPNDQSRPGYLSMGWTVAERLAVAVRPHGWAGTRRAIGAARGRMPADLWSQDALLHPAAEVLADPEVEAMIDQLPAPTAPTTPRTPAYLRWRYGLADLGYEVFPAGRDLADGILVGRVRRRGPATELAVCEVLVPEPRQARAALRAALRRSAADYAIGLGTTRLPGMAPVPRQGPLLTWRPLSAGSRPPQRLGLGDVELF